MEEKLSMEDSSMTPTRRRGSSGGIKKKKKVAKGRGNGGPENGECGFRGVRQRTWGRWVAEIWNPWTRRRVWLGSFATAVEAAIAYDAAARRFCGSDALLNFPHPSEDNEIICATAHRDDDHGDLGKFLERLMGNVMREPKDRLHSLLPASPVSSAQELYWAFHQDPELGDPGHHFSQMQMAESDVDGVILENCQCVMEDLSIPVPLPIWDFHDQ